MNFSERVKQLKKEKGLTNEMLAKSTGIPVGTLSKLLSGFTEEPKLSTALQLAKALGCSLEHLATGAAEPIKLIPDEEELVRKYRALDVHGVRVCNYILNEEYARCTPAAENVMSQIPQSISRGRAIAREMAKMRKIPLFEDRVSAGDGIYLSTSDTITINIVDNEKTRDADFALRVSGDSMEPRFHDGDILLVRSSPSVEIGQLGIFVCDGEGYFKEFGGSCLISLNKNYAPIPISSFSSFACRGVVVGPLRSKDV